MAEVGLGLGPADGGGEAGEGSAQALDSSLRQLAQSRFEFGERQLDRIEVGRVLWKQFELCSRRLDRLPYALDFVDGKIVHHDNVAALERRDEDLIEIGKEGLSVHRPIEDERRR